MNNNSIGEAVILNDSDVNYGTANKYLALLFPKDTFDVQNKCSNMRSQLQDMGIDTLMKEINDDYYLVIAAADLKTATK
ncbi:MAG: hypothetical protein Q4B70_18660 [Lachnospiraceae bacterium]|nr:hypothetical protein [Lachnospiraceae bacterium]